MKTAMQELWDYIDANYHEEGFKLYDAKEISLEKEKKQIIDAMEKTAMYVSAALIDKEIGKMTFEDLYNQTYNQNKTI